MIWEDGIRQASQIRKKRKNEKLLRSLPFACRVHIFAVLNSANDSGVWPKSLSSLLREEGAGGSLVAGVWASRTRCQDSQEGTAEVRKDLCGFFPRPPELLKWYLCNWYKMPIMC